MGEYIVGYDGAGLERGVRVIYMGSNSNKGSNIEKGGSLYQKVHPASLDVN